MVDWCVIFLLVRWFDLIRIPICSNANLTILFLLLEFLYPTGLGRWAHLLLVKMSSKKGKDKYHSRTLEQRIEVVPSALYIHPISQLMDNLAYLIVSCEGDGMLVGMLVDCGDAKECIEQLDLIRERHYDNRGLQIHAVLCTHKHHDHTAGNAGLLKKFGTTLKKVYGAVAERVPLANHFVSNGDMLKLPKLDDNDMNQYITVEVISVPGHTRGSVAYALRPKTSQPSHASFLFTGDTMFSAGGGVPFEADQAESRSQLRKKQVGSYIRASAGSNAVERCFVELTMRAGADDNVLIFPGHEYTNELLTRQFRPSADSMSWNRFAPAVFFRTASQLYVASHRRSLPTGKILAVPTLLSLEKDINPHFRKLHKRGEDVVRAVQLWYRVFARAVIANEGQGIVTKVSVKNKAKRSVRKQDSSDEIWNVTADDIAKPIFTAIYTADLEIIINELDGGNVNVAEAVDKLRLMRDRAELPVLNRRPIPGTLPNNKVMYSALLGLVILGTPPTAMTISDSRSMNLPRPVSPANTHTIKVSKSRVVAMLKFLGLITNTVEGRDLTTMIHNLWKEAADYGIGEDYKATLTDDELGIERDEMELGVLRWMLFGVEANQPTWFERFCMPCDKPPPPPPIRKHGINDASLRRTNGELVKHDALTCLLCRDVTGCPLSDSGLEKEEEIEDAAADVPIRNGATNGSAPSLRPPTADPHESIRLKFPPVGLLRGQSLPFDEDDDGGNVEVEMMR
jgi:glyoxylase-like metal-dependent hydrolase (beta-lactamase superfamily II)